MRERIVANARQGYACWKGGQCRGDRGGGEEGAGAEEKGEQDVEERYCEDPWSSGGTWSVKGAWKSRCTIRMIPICCGEGLNRISGVCCPCTAVLTTAGPPRTK